MSDKCLIQIRRETRERLKQAGHKGETYDTIVQRLLSQIEKEEGINAKALPQSPDGAGS